MSLHPESTVHTAAGGLTYPVVVRTLAGHTDAVTVHATETIAALTDREVTHFQTRHELGAGSYALSLPRRGSSANLDPTATLAEAGVRVGDVLVLIERTPQVDG